MVTVSHITKKLIDSNIILHEALSMNIVNYANVAKKLHADIERIYGEQVKISTIRQDVQRYSEKIQKEQKNFEFNFFQEINLNSDICYIVVRKSTDVLKKLQQIYYDLNLCDGGVFHILQGNDEIAILTKKECEKHVLEILDTENITHQENNHDAICLSYSRDYSHIPGLFYNISKNIAWEHINVLTWLHTPKELTLIVHEKDSTKCFEILRKMLKKHKVNEEKKYYLRQHSI